MCGPFALLFSWLFDLTKQDARVVYFLGCEDVGRPILKGHYYQSQCSVSRGVGIS